MVELKKSNKNSKKVTEKVVKKSKKVEKSKVLKTQTDHQKPQYILFFTDSNSELYQFWCQQSKQTLPLNKVLELTEDYQLI